MKALRCNATNRGMHSTRHSCMEADPGVEYSLRVRKETKPHYVFKTPRKPRASVASGVQVLSTPPPRPTRVVRKSRALVENEENEATLTQEDVRTTIKTYFQPLIEKLAKGSEEACNSDESRGCPPGSLR